MVTVPFIVRPFVSPVLSPLEYSTISGKYNRESVCKFYRIVREPLPLLWYPLQRLYRFVEVSYPYPSVYHLPDIRKVIPFHHRASLDGMVSRQSYRYKSKGRKYLLTYLYVLLSQVTSLPLSLIFMTDLP